MPFVPYSVQPTFPATDQNPAAVRAFVSPWWVDYWNQSVPTLAQIQAQNAPPTKRTLFSIRADLLALTTTQQTNVWNALIAGTPPLWATDAGSNAAAIAAIQMFGASSTLGAADVKEVKIRAAAMYAQDNPSWLVHPSFDSTINISGVA